MAKIRVHELARELGKQNKEVIEFLKEKGVDVKSHMSNLEDTQVSMVKEYFLQRGKEQRPNVDNSKAEEKDVVKPEKEKAEAPKKKKNIIRVFHAQNTSDGGKSRPRRPGMERRPGGQGRRPQGAAAPARKPENGPKNQERAAAAKPAPARPVRNAASAEEKPMAAEGKVTEQQIQTQKQEEAPAQAQRQSQPAENGRQVQAQQTARQPQQGGSRQQNNRPARDNRDNRERRDNRDNREFRSGDRRQNDRQQQNRQGQNQGPNRSFRQGDGQNRSRQGEGGERRQNNNFKGQNQNQNYGQGRSQGNYRNQGGQSQGQGRQEGRSDNRFGGRDNRNTDRRRNENDAVFAPEMAKTSKDSKRERDRENKNKKKDFDKSQNISQRPNQGGRRQMSRLPKALQKPVPQPKQEEKKPEVKEITLPEKMTIRELAEAMKMQPSVIVKKLFLEGVMVTVNHEIDFEKAQEIALDYDIIAEQEEKEDIIGELLKEDEEDESTMEFRPPVVCVMGHVDHGKTSLLDAIRNTNVTRGEAGGITQHIGASVVKINGQKITFLDTPGHEAFTAMRMRGANATDIAVLVVAADDGVMPQTVEAISHAKAAGVEIIVAINKIDKPSANVERVKQELSEYELIPEDWGGSTVFVPVSAHTGEGIETLLEMILLTAEVLELKANPKRAARGLVIEAQLDKGKGPVATILVQKGTLHVGDFIAAGACSGKVRAMMDDRGRRVKEAGPSTPVEILGLGDVPNAGEILMSFESDKEAKNFAGAFVSENKNRLLEETRGKLSLDNLFDQIQASDLKELPIVVKADVQGSVEAVKQSLVKLSNDEVVVRVIHGGVGAINESDVSLAATSNAIIIGFNVRPDAMAKQLAEQEGVDLRLYKVIYQAIEDVEAAMKGMLDPVFEEKVIGHAEVRQLFKASGVGTIAGSYILDGVFQRNCKVRVFREGEQIFEGELASLKRFKDDVKEVKTGFECGLVIAGFNDIKEEDQVEAYIMVEVPR